MSEEHLDDLRAIKRLKARYFRCLDTKDWEGWRTVFTDDVVIDTTASGGARWEGADDFIAQLRAILGDQQTVHQGHMPEIDVTGPDTATGIWALKDHVRFPDGSQLIGYGHYHETYKKIDGQWKIATSALTRLRTDTIPPAGIASAPDAVPSAPAGKLGPRPLTLAATTGEWLDDPVAGPALRALFAELGVDEATLGPARGLKLAQVIEFSQGAMDKERIEAIAREINGGDVDEIAETALWSERISAGRFEGKTIIVTGAASGIGRATASRIVREGGRVVGVDIKGPELSTLAEELGERFVPLQADVRVEADVARAIAAAGERIDGLANVAGVVDDFSPIHEVTDAEWNRVFDTNVVGILRCSRAAIPAMLKTGHGAVVNISSEAAMRGSAAGVAYTASKHAVVGISESCAVMYGPHGIRVNTVVPGGVATGMPQSETPSQFGHARLDPLIGSIPGVATAEQLAASITFLLSDDGVNINGALLTSDKGWAVQ